MRGDTLTVWKMAEYFGARHELDLLCHPPARPDDAERVRPLVRELFCVPFSRWRAALGVAAAVAGDLPFQVAWCASPAMRRLARHLVEERGYDVVIPYYVRTAECVRDLRGPAKVAAMQLSLSLQWARAAEQARSPLRRWLRRCESRRLGRYESRLFADFDRCLLISPRDRDHIANHVPEKVFFNPHGVDTEAFSPDRRPAETDGKLVVFTGGMQFQPNVDAACHFARDLLPLVRRRVRDARFAIVGNRPTAAVRALARLPGVTVTGHVPDIAAHLGRAAVAVDPLRVGAGLQNKVLEALSMGVPMVATPLANEGIGAVDGEHLLIRDDGEAFAEAVARLLGDADLRGRLGQAGRQWILRHWTWEHHFARLEQMLLDLVASRRGR